MAARKPSPCRIIKDQIVSHLFPVIDDMGFRPDKEPHHSFGWDVSTGSYFWEFRRFTSKVQIDLLAVHLVCSHLIVHVEFAKFSNEPQADNIGQITDLEELSVFGLPNSVRKRLLRCRGLLDWILRQYSMRARRSNVDLTRKRAGALVAEICSDMRFVRAYFEGGDTQGRIR